MDEYYGSGTKNETLKRYIVEANNEIITKKWRNRNDK